MEGKNQWQAEVQGSGEQDAKRSAGGRVELWLRGKGAMYLTICISDLCRLSALEILQSIQKTAYCNINILSYLILRNP